MAKKAKEVKLSTDNLKELHELLTFGLELTNAVVKTAADKKFKVVEVFNFTKVVPTISPAFEGLGNPIQRYKALMASEKQELFTALQSQFDIPNDDIEKLVEDTIEAVMLFFEVADRWKAILGKKS